MTRMDYSPVRVKSKFIFAFKFFAKFALSFAVYPQVIATISYAQESKLASTIEFAEETSKIPKILPGVELIQCSRLSSTSQNECVNYQLTMGYYAMSLFQALYGSLEEGWLAGHGDLEGFKRFGEGEIRPAYKNMDEYIENRKTYRLIFFSERSRELSRCLRMSCKGVANFSKLSSEMLADIWDQGMDFELCLETQKYSDFSRDIHKPLLYGFDDNPKTFIYRAALDGLVPNCKPSRFVREFYFPIIFNVLER